MNKSTITKETLQSWVDEFLEYPKAVFQRQYSQEENFQFLVFRYLHDMMEYGRKNPWTGSSNKDHLSHLAMLNIASNYADLLVGWNALRGHVEGGYDVLMGTARRFLCGEVPGRNPLPKKN